jgi:hypothetical protein
MSATATEWRLARLEEQQRGFDQDLRTARTTLVEHEEQITGDNGLLAAMRELKEEMSNVRKALYTAAGGAVFSAISVAIAIAVYGH